MRAVGYLEKMNTRLKKSVEYSLAFRDGTEVPLNKLVGKKIEFNATGKIQCVSCQKQLTKTYQNGYCYPCTLRLAECDSCIVRPELCHYSRGTCRDPAWGERHCMQEHIVYLAYSSQLKVGITRKGQVPTRWIDQGASMAIPLFIVASRFYSGLIEVILKSSYSDRTSWQKMLKSGNDAPDVDLEQERENIFNDFGAELDDFVMEFGEDVIELDESTPPTKIVYPINEVPTKISSLKLSKNKNINARLMGIKGQYLIFESGVINIRSHSSYEVEFVV